MKSSEILEGNKLIAEFMGFISNGNMYQCCFGNVNKYSNLVSMSFHKSYEWIMPVVEKIESLNYTSEIYTLSCNTTTAFYSGGVVVYKTKLQNSKIESIYRAVVGFILWYNATIQNYEK